MKSNFYGAVNKTALRRELTREVDKRLDAMAEDIHARIKHSVSTQTMAVVFWVLHREHGWGRDRMQRLKNEIEDEFVLMHKGVMGVKYNPVELREKLKSEFGVDFDTTRYEGGID